MAIDKWQMRNAKREMISNKNIWSVDAVLEATSGRLLQGGGEYPFAGICTDTRTLSAGTLFVALKGESFDGHRFVDQAVKAGASGVVVALQEMEKVKNLKLPIPVIGVVDTLRALGDLAAYWRRRHSLPVIAITGSNGKTTTKEMVAAILGRSWKVLKNQGTFNNLVGLPLTLFQLSGIHQAAVVELGMNQPGEIKRLTEIADPDVGLITNIQPAHLEGVASLDGVQAAKGELFAGMRRNSTIVVNRDDRRIAELASAFPGRQVGFSTAGGSAEVALDRVVGMDINGTHFVMELGDEIQEIHLHVIGRHHVENAVAAAAVAWSLDIPARAISDGLADFQPVDKRMEVLALPGDINIINDTYNANPGSMAAALETLIRVKGRGKAVAVLGDMLELGADSVILHRQVGNIAGQKGIDYLLAMGEKASHVLAGAAESGMQNERLTQASEHGELARRVDSLLSAGDWVLVKGSRGMRMEKVVEELIDVRSSSPSSSNQEH